MNNISINYCNYHLSNPDHDKIDRPNGSGDYIFLLFHSHMMVELNGEIIPISPGGCILFTPGNPQIYWAVEKFSNSFAHFSSRNSSLINQFNIPHDQVFYPKNTLMIDDILRRIYAESLEKIEHFENMQEYLLLELFIECERQLTTDITNSDMFNEFRKARLTILSNPEQNWNVDSMAQLINMGSSQFYSYYTKYFGKSPKAELIDIRLEKAQYLLSQGNMTVKQVAEQCGFNNLPHFTRYFTKRFGIPPSKYNKKSQLEKL